MDAGIQQDRRDLGVLSQVTLETLLLQLSCMMWRVSIFWSVLEYFPVNILHFIQENVRWEFKFLSLLMTRQTVLPEHLEMDRGSSHRTRGRRDHRPCW